MSGDSITIMEISADYLYLVVCGDFETITEITNDFNKTVDENTKYLCVKLCEPIANKYDELYEMLNDNKQNKKNIIFEDGMEAAQCYVYADGHNSQTYMILTINEKRSYYVIGYPKFDLVDDDEPELFAEEWCKKSLNKIPVGFKKNMKMITVVGVNTNILIMSTKLNKKKKKILDN